MKKLALKKRIAKIIDQLSKGETTTHIVEEILKSFDTMHKKISNDPNNKKPEK